MSFIPNTTCRRCHRQYPAFRGRCPYCGTKKTKEVRSAVPETDSAVPGTRAARSAAEAVNWQMLIGGVLLLAVIISTLVMVSVNIGRDVNDQQSVQNSQNQQGQQGTQDQPPSAFPALTPTPEPTNTPAPSIQTVQITWYANQTVSDYSGMSFGARKGDVYQNFKVSWFPIDVVAIPVWSSSDENVVTVDPAEGVETTLRFIGNSGDTATISVDVNGTVRSFNISIN